MECGLGCLRFLVPFAIVKAGDVQERTVVFRSGQVGLLFFALADLLIKIKRKPCDAGDLTFRQALNRQSA